MPHIVTAFDDDLIAIQAKISEMGGLAEEILANALDAFKNRDAELAQTAIDRDKRLDDLEIELREKIKDKLIEKLVQRIMNPGRVELEDLL